MSQPSDQEFRTFVHEVEPGLRRSLVAALGAQRGRDAAADALAWAWENWSKVEVLDNPTGYLFRVGQSKTRSRKVPMIAPVETWEDPLVEPELPAALSNLTESQRLAVVMVHAYGWTLRELAELSGTSISTVQTHLERGLSKLRDSLSIEVDRRA
jgi:RNA polymerase sigma factor (sigma-70 family)